MLFDELPIQRRSSQAPPPDNQSGRGRLLFLMLAVVLVFLSLSGRILYLQTTRQEEFSREAVKRSNITRFTPATRGLIYDRNGVPLVRNAPSYQIAIVPIRQVTYSEDQEAVNPVTGLPITNTNGVAVNEAIIKQRIERIAVYNRLAQLVNQPGITAGEIYTKVLQARQAGRTFEPVVVAENVPRDTAQIIQEQSLLLPGVVVQTVGSRIYPYGELFGNILGYTGKILDTTALQYDLQRSGADLVDVNSTGYRYNIDNDRIGVTGIESFVERELRGVKGVRESVVDVSFEEISVIKETTPTVGNNVRLALDLRLQNIISESMRYGLRETGSTRGAVVALNPNTGEILGMVGFPTYDNNLFARGITPDELKALNEDIHKPQLNHATQEAVQPGSTFKVISAASILQETEDSVDASTMIDDPGVFILPNEFNTEAEGQKFFCWIGLRGGRHGLQNTELALKNSCNTYFRKAIGGFKPDNIIGVGSDALSKWAQAFGIGEDTYDLGIPYVPGYPASFTNNLQRQGGIWTQGDDYNIAIGQGKLNATVLEMANVAAVIANGGTLYQPQLVRDVINSQNQIVRPFEPKVLRKVPLDAEYFDLIQRAMWRVVNEEGGTAWYSASLQKWGLEYAGKTGTAEYCDDIAQKARLCPPDREFLPTHAWYIAYAPAQNPQIALAVYVYNGGQGSGTAAPVAARILAKYFNLPIQEEELPKIVKNAAD
jgi:penicillin-binding protein 2